MVEMYWVETVKKRLILVLQRQKISRRGCSRLDADRDCRDASCSRKSARIVLFLAFIMAEILKDVIKL
jgi:hypothetical protein